MRNTKVWLRRLGLVRTVLEAVVFDEDSCAGPRSGSNTPDSAGSSRPAAAALDRYTARDMSGGPARQLSRGERQVCGTVSRRSWTASCRSAPACRPSRCPRCIGQPVSAGFPLLGGRGQWGAFQVPSGLLRTPPSPGRGGLPGSTRRHLLAYRWDLRRRLNNRTQCSPVASGGGWWCAFSMCGALLPSPDRAELWDSTHAIRLDSRHSTRLARGP